MLICQDCGEQNQIGRVFCASCGVKLDLDGLRSEDVRAMGAIPWWKRYWKLLALVPVLIVALAWGMRLWPKVDRIGLPGSGAGRMRVIRALERVQQISDGDGAVRSAEVVFDEADINAYLRYEVEPKLGARVSVDLAEGMVLVRVVRPRFSWGLPKGYRFEPDASYDFVCGLRSKQLIPYKVRVGHASAGLAKKRVSRAWMGIFGARDEAEVLALAETLALRNDKLVLQVRRR